MIGQKEKRKKERFVSASHVHSFRESQILPHFFFFFFFFKVLREGHIEPTHLNFSPRPCSPFQQNC